MIINNNNIIILNKYNIYTNIFYTFKRKIIILNKILNNNKLFNFFYILLFLINFNKKKYNNFLSKFNSSFSSKKIRSQKSSGKSRIKTKSTNIFVGGYYCFGFREFNFKFYNNIYNKYISYFFNFLNINKRSLINYVDYYYLKLIFSLFLFNNNYNYYYYLLYFNKFYKNKYSFNFINNSKSIYLCIKNLKIYNNIIFF